LTRSFIVLLIALAVPSPALAEAAFALGTCDDGYPYGFSWNNASRSAARQSALGYCQKNGGADCKIIADDLNRLCLAFAIDKAQVCHSYGLAYDPNRATAEQEAISTCTGHGGKDCRVTVSQCDDGGGGHAGAGKPGSLP
jgi:hypothetical protein